MANLALTLLIYHTLGWMSWQERGVSLYRPKVDHRVVTCVPHSREFPNITRFSNLFITNSRVLPKNIFLLPCGEYFRKLTYIIPTYVVLEYLLISWPGSWLATRH